MLVTKLPKNGLKPNLDGSVNRASLMDSKVNLGKGTELA